MVLGRGSSQQGGPFKLRMSVKNILSEEFRKHVYTLVGALALLSSCGGTSQSESGPEQITVLLVVKTEFGGPTTFARNNQGQCGARLDRSTTGLDTSGKMTVTDRSGILLGSANIPLGILTKLDVSMPDQQFRSQECTFTIQVKLFEKSKDLSLFEFNWSGADVNIQESAEVTANTVKFEYGP